MTVADLREAILGMDDQDKVLLYNREWDVYHEAEEAYPMYAHEIDNPAYPLRSPHKTAYLDTEYGEENAIFID